MAISTYSELKTAIKNWLNRSDIDSNISEFIALGEARFYRELRIQPMEQALSVAISSGVVAVPSDYLQMKFIYLDGSEAAILQRRSNEFIYTEYPTRSASSKPAFFSREGSNFIFGPYPDSDYTVKGIYYKKLPALSDSNTTNWFTENAPDLLLWSSLLEAEPFLKNDSRVAIWGSKYQASIQDIRRQDKSEAMSGSPPRAIVYSN